MGMNMNVCVCEREGVRTHLVHPFPFSSFSSSIVTLAAASAAALSANVVASQRIASSREKKFSCRPYEWVAWMSGPTTKYIQQRASLTWLYSLPSSFSHIGVPLVRRDEGRRIISFVLSSALSRVCQNFE